MLGGLELALVGLAAVGAGFVNALAGGGTLITFPALLAAGVPAVAANVTNTVALCPGYLSATWAQRRDLRDQQRRIRLFVPASLVGGVLGGLLLLGHIQIAHRRAHIADLRQIHQRGVCQQRLSGQWSKSRSMQYSRHHAAQASRSQT